MFCKAGKGCGVAVVAQETIRFGHDDNKRVTLYRCPTCGAEYVAKMESWTDVPIVLQLAPVEEDPVKEIPGERVALWDILAANDTGHIWA